MRLPSLPRLRLTPLPRRRPRPRLPLRRLITTTTAVVPAPAQQTGGTVTVTASVCRLDGPPIIGDDSFLSIGPSAWATDGSLYLLDNEAKVRRYTVTPGADCVLTMDTTLGEGGRLTLGEGMGGAPKGIVADGQGHIYVSSSMRGTHRITGTTVDYHCETMGDLSVSPNGRDGFAKWIDTVKRVTFTDTGCTVADWTPTDMFERIDSVSFLDARRILVGGHAAASSSPHLVRIFDVNGRPSGPAFGDSSDSMNAPDHFCHVHGAVACGDNLCVMDGNCRALRIFDQRNAIIGKIDLSRLVGVDYPWFPAMTPVRNGTAYITVNQQRGASHPRPDIYDGFVVRLSGL